MPGQNPDPAMGMQTPQDGSPDQIDPATGNPQNMSQTVGQMNQNRPSLAGFQPGVSPRPAESVRPQKMGVPTPGTAKFGERQVHRVRPCHKAGGSKEWGQALWATCTAPLRLSQRALGSFRALKGRVTPKWLTKSPRAKGKPNPAVLVGVAKPKLAASQKSAWKFMPILVCLWPERRCRRQLA